MIIIPVLLVFYFVTLDYSDISRKDSGKVSKIEDYKVNEENFVKETQTKEKTALVSYNDEEINLSLDDYVIGVVACEVPASFEFEALKAMSVVARSFYLYKDFMVDDYVASNSDQCFNNESIMRDKWGSDYEKYYELIRKAVEETSGEVVTYNDSIAETFYFSTSNGKTEDVKNVFGEDLPYLVSVDSSWDKNVSTYQKTVEYSISDFLSKLEISQSDTIDYEILSLTPSGRIDKLLVNGVEFKGTDFRKKLGLRSTDFDLKIDGSVFITTRGYGHGVGMSQWGSNEMAKLGFTYKDIIKYYYKGVEIIKN